jgi:hypothetical protein
MKLTKQSLKQLIKEELEVILTDDEAAELFGDQIDHIIAEITKKVIPPEWARPDFAGYSKPFGSPYPGPGGEAGFHRRAHGRPVELPTATQKHDWAMRQRRGTENAKRAAHLEKRGVLNRAAQGDVKLFRQLRADAFGAAWEAEKKAAAERLNQAVMSGTDVKPPGANKAAARSRAHQIAKSKLKKSIAKRVGAEEAEFLAKEILRFDASETPYTREWLKARQGERAGRWNPRRRPSWSPDPATLDPRIAAAEGAQLSPDHLRRLRSPVPIGRYEGKLMYASPQEALHYFRGVAGDPAFESPRITSGPAPEGYTGTGTTQPLSQRYSGPPIPKGKSTAQKKALKRTATKAALKKGAGFVGRRVLSPAMTAWLAHDAYSGGKWGQAPLSKPGGSVRQRMGLGIPLIPGAPEYIQSGQGYEMSPDDPDYWTGGSAPETWETHPTKHKGGWGITDIDTSAPITKYLASQLRGQPAPTPFKRKAGKAADDPEYLAQRQRERDANVRAAGYDLDKAYDRDRAERDLTKYVDTGKRERVQDLAVMLNEPNRFEKERLAMKFKRNYDMSPETIKRHNVLEPIRRESLTPASLRQMIIEELGFGEGKPVDDEWSKKKTYIVEDEVEQLELPGMETPALCEPADGVDGLSSQLAQMVVDSGTAPEELNDLMELIYDKVAANLEGIGIEDEEDTDDYRRTTIGFMEALKKATVNILIEKEIITGGEESTTVDSQDDNTSTEKAAAAAEQKSAAESNNPGDPGSSGEQAGYTTDAAALRQTDKEDTELDEKKQPSEKSAKKAHKALKKTAKKKFPKDKERQDRYIYGGKRKMGWKPKRERK